MNNLTKSPKWFVLAAAVALLWNLMGVAAYISQTMMTPEMLAALPDNERSLYEGMPLLINIAFCLAVVLGTLGCIALLLKKKWALPLFIGSFIGSIVQTVYNIFISGAIEVYGAGSLVLPVMVIVICIVLIWLARKAIDNQWIV